MSESTSLAPNEPRAAVGAIVLAAGRSSRMGQHKLLLPLGNRPLVSYAAAAACASNADPVWVILGHNAAAVEAALKAALPAGGYSTRLNTDFATGMASSLRTGIAQLLASATPLAGVIVLLADQPLITAQIINHLLETASATPEAIIAASYAGTRSTPVYFPQALFDELLQITGDEGGRSVIAHHPELLRLEVIKDADAGVDIDQPDEYEQLRARWNDTYPAKH